MAEVDRLKSLEQLRDLLKERIVDDDEGHKTAALARQYRDTLREIDELKRGSKKGTLVDELANRRKTRGSATKSRTATKRSRSVKGS